MKKQYINNRMGTSTLAFILFAILYLFFFVLLRYDLKPNAALFWFSSISMVIIILWQIFHLQGNEKFILLEIFVLTLLFHLQAVIPCRFGLIGDDPNNLFYVTRGIIEYGIPLPESILSIPPYNAISSSTLVGSYYPVLFVVGAAAFLITGLDLISILNWLPSIWSSTAILAIYILTNSIYNDKRAGLCLLAALGFSSYHMFIAGHCQYYRESIAFVLLIFAIFIYVAIYERSRAKLSMSIVGILLSVSIVLAHYFVTLIWLLWMGIWFFNSKLIDAISGKGIFFPHTSVIKRSSQIFIALSAVIAFAYWIYIETQVFPAIFGSRGAVPNYVRYGEVAIHTYLGPTLKQEIIRYLSWFTTIVFASILIFEVLKREKCKNIKDDMLIGIWAALGFAFVEIAATNPELLQSGRLAVFFFPFILIGVAHSILNIKKDKIKKILIFIVILFIALQLFRLSYIPLSPIEVTEQAAVSDGLIKSISTVNRGPQNLPGIKAAQWFGTEKNPDLNFTIWFTIKGKKYLAEPKERGRRLYSAEWYAKEYIVVTPERYLDKNLVYDNEKAKIWTI